MYDEHALRIWTDGSCPKYNPGGPSGLAGVIEYPASMNKVLEKAFAEGYKSSSNQRMELRAVIKALEFIRKHKDSWEIMGISRSIIITDSDYVAKYQHRAQYWRNKKWVDDEGLPYDNQDLWRKLLSLQASDYSKIIYHKGKTTEANILADKLAKERAKVSPNQIDFGFSPGKISRAPIRGKVIPFPAKGQIVSIRIYRYEPIGLGKTKKQKVFFTLEDVEITDKYFAYMDLPKFSRHGKYLASFSSVSRKPVIESLAANE